MKKIALEVIQSVYDRFEDGSGIYQLIIDEQRGHYLLYRNAWEKSSFRFYGTLVHLEVKNDKIWLQYDGTDLIIADWILERGISPKELVLGFHPPIARQDTEFAVA